MKKTILLAALAVGALTVSSAHTQGTFQNLNFEQANPVLVIDSPYYPYEATTASALPYWTVTIGGVQQTQVFYDTVSLGAVSVSLIGNGGESASGGILPLAGNYSVYLQGSYFPRVPLLAKLP